MQRTTSTSVGGAAQRRVVSVLFADLVGFTTLSQRRDAEDVRELLTRYFDLARAAIERHGGVVEKFIGDAVMAVWGTEVAHEDDAERAVRAALEVVEAVHALGADVGIDLAARGGVLTGEAAVTVGATGQGMVAGDLVNTASRLQSAADPGTVLVGAETYRATADAIAFDPRGEIDVKGRDEPVTIWQAARVVGQRGGTGRPGRPEPPFVARGEELRLVKELLHVTAREQRARLVSITGIGGIGKSRLAWEFEKYVDGLSDDVFWHQGRCPAYGEGVTFWALGEMVRMRAGIAETDEPVDARRKLGDMLARYLRDDDERRWAEPRFAHLLGLDDAPTGSAEELFAAWRTLFERIAERGVTTMVFEDVHWADPGLLDFIESLLEWSRNAGILVLTLARPELLDRRPTWGAGQRNYTALHLDTLDDDGMRRLVTGFVRGVDDGDANRIISRSEGVPLYAVETIRMLADNGALTPDGNCYSVTGDIGALEVPGTLHALIAARLDVLGADDRELLRDAAVLGTSFTPAALASIRDESATDLEPRLRHLVRKEFLLQDTDPRSPERGQYAFVQSLIREVAYGTLSKPDRRRKHLAVAAYLQSGDDDELVGVVASHYLEALRATPEGPEGDALASTVREHVIRAGQRALSLGSPQQALTYVEKALELSPDTERTALLALAADAAARTGDYELAMRYFDDATALASQQEDWKLYTELQHGVFRPLLMLDRSAEGLRRMEDALSRLPADSDDATRGELYIAISEVRSLSGDMQVALADAETALTAAERASALPLIARCISQKSTVLFTLGRHQEALVLARGAVDLARTHGSPTELGGALLNLGVQVTEVSPRESYETFSEMSAVGRRGGIRSMEDLGTANAIEGAIDLGAFAEAEALLADLRPRASGFIAAGLSFNAAVLKAYRGDATGAEAELAAVASRSEVAERMVPEQTWHLRASSLVRLLNGDLDGAYLDGMSSVALDPTGMNAPNALTGCAHAAAALRDADKLRETSTAMQALPGPWMQRQRRSVEAAIAALDGRVAEATAEFAAVLDEWCHEELPVDHAWCVADAAAVLPDGHLDPAHLERARTTAADLGAVGLSRRLPSSVVTAGAS